MIYHAKLDSMPKADCNKMAKARPAVHEDMRQKSSTNDVAVNRSLGEAFDKSSGIIPMHDAW
jgi:hypothetical protein